MINKTRNAIFSDTHGRFYVFKDTNGTVYYLTAGQLSSQVKDALTLSGNGEVHVTLTYHSGAGYGGWLAS